MTDQHPNFLSDEDKLVEPKQKKIKGVTKWLASLLAIFGILLIFFGIGVISSGENLSQTFGNTSLWGQIKHLIASDDKQLLGENQDRINVLLLGMGGLAHEGPFLTDTIIIASLKPSTNQVALISVPRDLSVPVPGYGWRKINHVNSFGEVKNPGRGGELVKEVISQAFGVPIHYYVRIDFAGFQQIVDDLSGITVTVENTLDDPFYPVPGKETATTSERFEHLVVEEGSQHMDGDLALKFVRSRMGRGIEGSDFARSRRQQLVLAAIKEKVLSFSTIINPVRISRLTDTLSEHLATDLKVWEILRLFNLTRDVDENQIIRRVFDDSPDGELYATITEEGAFILLPRDSDFSRLQLITQHIFNLEKLDEIKPKFVEIHNGTRINGLAYRSSQYLQSLGYQVTRIKNAPTQDYQKTVVYNLAQEGDPTARHIAELLDAELAPSIPAWVQSTSSSSVSPQTDVLVVLGEDQNTN